MHLNGKVVRNMSFISIKGKDGKEIENILAYKDGNIIRVGSPENHLLPSYMMTGDIVSLSIKEKHSEKYEDIHVKFFTHYIGMSSDSQDIMPGSSDYPIVNVFKVQKNK